MSETTEMISTAGVTRGCGKRKPGGLYLCCGMGNEGLPLDHFVIDPPRPYEAVPPRSPQFYEADGTTHIIMGVGEEFYPWASDFIEECKRFGLSKRVADSFPIEKLTRNSRIVLVHRKAIVNGHEALPRPEYCPKDNPAHKDNSEPCIGHLWQLAQPDEEGGSRRTIGDTSYSVFPFEGDISSLGFEPGMFLWLPLTHIDYVKTEDGAVDPAIAGKATNLPLNICDE